ncbi:C2H2-like zinc finger protein [Arabidopsis thaliana]|uniref:C2H2-like zinc finger protein n=3 Tax=Arabidopsis thaliana TaxID=3702 RepID=Q1PF47_ARATH|nr:C2H2-like zinc finger protein [Arabidopsis thaliana]ABE65452.1 zinc finger family protein [Arabidopsis thaliana]ANM61789.1 C2H2-like zinc finger protein [Arabidopsis thaliana]|eukprot:NP_001323986.1 C2H2-like zinc finger protein [Arabidopsis thaliana]
MNHNSKMIRSMFTTSDFSNHRDLFSSSPSFSCYQNSHVSSSSFGFNNSQVMRRNIDYVSSTDYLPIKDNPHLTRVSFTQTITNRYSSIVPTNSLDAVQYDIELVKRAMDSKPNIWNPVFYPPNFLGKQCEILNPEPLNVIFPHQNSGDRQYLNMFSLSSKHNHDQNVFHEGRSSTKIPKPTMSIEKTTEYIDCEENEKSDDAQYDGRIHSLPYKKYGPYTCPKCNSIFDTSQKFAAHMSSHYKSETNKERAQRFRARNKRKYRKLNLEVYGESQKIKQEDGVHNDGRSDDKPIQHHKILFR